MRTSKKVFCYYYIDIELYEYFFDVNYIARYFNCNDKFKLGNSLKNISGEINETIECFANINIQGLTRIKEGLKRDSCKEKIVEHLGFLKEKIRGFRKLGWLKCEFKEQFTYREDAESEFGESLVNPSELNDGVGSLVGGCIGYQKEAFPEEKTPEQKKKREKRRRQREKKKEDQTKLVVKEEEVEEGVENSEDLAKKPENKNIFGNSFKKKETPARNNNLNLTKKQENSSEENSQNMSEKRLSSKDVRSMSKREFDSELRKSGISIERKNHVMKFVDGKDDTVLKATHVPHSKSKEKFTYHNSLTNLLNKREESTSEIKPEKKEMTSSDNNPNNKSTKKEKKRKK